MPRRKVALFLCLLLTYGAFVGRPGVNERSRLALTIALVQEGTPAIEGVLAACPAAATSDFSIRGGHIYSNKAPGGPLAAAPVYAALRAAERRAGLDPLGEGPFIANAWAQNLLFNAALVALAAVVLGGVAAEVAGRDVGTAATLAFGVGTIVFPYATVYFSHGTAAALLFLSFAIALREARRAGGPRAARLFGAGLIAGLAGATEYPAAVAAGILAVHVLVRTRSLRAAVAFAAGGVPALALLIAYHTACFGGPLTTAYAFENPVNRPAGLFQAPTPGVLAALTVTPYRGLFLYSPVLAAGAVALVAVAARRGPWRVEAATALAVFVFFLGFTASFNGWRGGAAHGARYLVPAIPFLAIGVGPALAHAPRTTAALAIAGGAVALAVALTGVGVDGDLPFPLRDATLPALLGRDAHPFAWIGPRTAARLAVPAAAWMAWVALASRTAARRAAS
jgi:hypothetical protein